MQSVTKALERILHQHEPFPALVMDRYWNVLMTNDSAPRFFNCFIDMSRRKGPCNMLHLMFDPDGMRPFVEHWDEVASSLIHRLSTEATGRVIDEKSKELIAALLAYPEVKPGPNPGATLGREKTRQSHPGPGDEGNSATGTTPTLPMIPISFRKSEAVLNYFSMVTTVGIPQTVAEELRLAPEPPAEHQILQFSQKPFSADGALVDAACPNQEARLRRCHVFAPENGSSPAGSKNNALLHGLHGVPPRGRRGWTKDLGPPLVNAHHAYYLF